MSIDFGNDIYEEPIVAKTFLQEDAQGGVPPAQDPAGSISARRGEGQPGRVHPGRPEAGEALDHVRSTARPAWARPRWPDHRPGDGVGIRITSGPAIEKPGDLAALLTNLNEGTSSLWTRSTG